MVVNWKEPKTNAKPGDFYYIVELKTAIEIKPTAIAPLPVTAGGAPVTKPAVAVPKVYKYMEDRSICDGKNVDIIKGTFCRIPMPNWWKGTYAQPEGTIISARVACCNRKGCSKFSKVNTVGAKVEGVP